MEIEKFNFTDEEFLKVINMICEEDHPLSSTFSPVMIMEESLAVDRLDSLGMTIFFIWLSELFGISDTAIEEFTDKGLFTINDIKKFVTVNCTKTYSYIEGEDLRVRCS